MDNHVLLLILFDIGLIIGLARLVGIVFQKIGQPPVIGEIVAGLMLGPSFLGAVHPALMARLFSAEAQSSLFLLSQIGLIFYMFLVGLQLNTEHLKKDIRSALIISNVSILLPFCLGVLFSYGVLHRVNGLPGVDQPTLALFVGAAISITAFPVLARILSDSGLSRTPLGTLALAAASIDDISAWCLLAIAVAVSRTDSIASALPTLALIVGYVALMATLGHRLCKYFMNRYQSVDQLQQWLLTIIYIAVIVSAIITDSIGIDVIFGGFIVGAIMPKNKALTQQLTDRTEDFISTFMLPIFFAYSGLNTRVGLLNTPELWMISFAIIVLAIIGKHTGVYVVARWLKIPHREAGALAWLMNTRGLTELIILNVGLKLNVISPTVFTMFVIMALVTTLMASPLLNWIYPESLRSAPARVEN